MYTTTRLIRACAAGIALSLYVGLMPRIASAQPITPPQPDTPVPGGEQDGADDAAPDDAPPEQTPEQRPWAVGVSAEDQEQAGALFEEGDDLLKEFQLPEALAKYEQALRHWKHPAIHFRVASVLFSLGRPVDAYAHTQKALEYGEAPLGTQFYQGAERYKELLERTLAWVTISCRENGAEVTLDGELLFRGPGSVTKILQAGPHTVVATRRGLIPATENLSLEQGGHASLELTLRAEKQRERFYPTVGRVGGSVRVLVDAAAPGATVAAAGSYGLLPRLDISVGGIAGKNPGLDLCTTIFLRNGSWRPTLIIGVPMLWATGSGESPHFQPGARLGLGFEWTLTRAVGLVSQVTVDYFPRASATHITSLLVPSMAIQIRR